MRTRLWCLILGHDFRMFSEEVRNGETWYTKKPGDWCRNCGRTKEELK